MVLPPVLAACVTPAQTLDTLAGAGFAGDEGGIGMSERCAITAEGRSLRAERIEADCVRMTPRHRPTNAAGKRRSSRRHARWASGCAPSSTAPVGRRQGESVSVRVRIMRSSLSRIHGHVASLGGSL